MSCYVYDFIKIAIIAGGINRVQSYEQTEVQTRVSLTLFNTDTRVYIYIYINKTQPGRMDNFMKNLNFSCKKLWSCGRHFLFTLRSI